MRNYLDSITRASLRVALAMAACLFILAACSSDDNRKEEKKDERPAQEKVLILKKRFEQLDTSLKEMERDLEIHKKRIDSTRELVDSIRHSLTKGGLKGYNLDNVSTTDPLLLQAISQEQAERKEKKAREEQKDKADDKILNGLLIGCFLLIIFAIFMVALKDRKSAEPLMDSPVTPPLSPDDRSPADADAPDAFDNDTTPGIDDTGSFLYNELRPPKPKTDEGDKPGPDHEQPL